MGLEDIEKLKARLQKDPDSKLFLPLAEEYRKEGMYDEAIDVLLKGLDRHPGYTSARVLLGKIYLEKGQLEDARKELEKVIETVPDNLFAQKKLAEIYKESGDTAKAIQHYEKVVELNPLDGEAVEILNELKSASVTISEDISATSEEQIQEEDFEGISFGEPSEEDAFVTEEIHKPLEEESFEDEQTEDVISFDETFGESEETEKEDTPEEILKEDIDFQEYQDFTQFINEKVHDFSEEPEPMEQPDDSPMFSVPEDEFMSKSADTAAEEIEKDTRDIFSLNKDAVSVGEVDVESMFAEANDYIKSEQYIKAMEIYTEILRIDPENRKAKQQMEELKQFLKLLGKDSDIIVSRLEDFLQGIKERRDEFFGDS